MVHPTPNRLIGHRQSAFRQQIFDVAQAEGEPKIEPYSLVNDLRRETISAVADFLHPLGYSATGRTASPTRRDNALGWEIAGRYNEEIHSALLRPPIAVWREHEASRALRMPKDRMAFWVSFLPDAHRTLRPDGIWLHDIPYWSNALSGQVGRAKSELLIKFDPRDVSRIFVQHPDSRFLEARARPLGFPAISLREWNQAKKALGGKGRKERNDEQITKTALALRQLIEKAIAKTAAARRAPVKTKNGDEADFNSMTGIDSRIPTVLELVERRRDRKTRPSDG